ncbi:MAG: excinuclease ABC subunit UvrA [Synergistales bacterium]|nr:excinuclease ABC subunit UvrA [Synergistales bacterium]
MSQQIVVRGAREHNLKDIDVTLPKERITVITGPSGSGKSTLAFDTIYAEGQRRYIESLSAYIRQFLGVQGKPDVEDISGLSPAIAIEQRVHSHNPRSTVGTTTEIYDYLRLLFGRVGRPTCPSCGRELQRHTLDEIVDVVLQQYSGSRLEILAPVVRNQRGQFRNLFKQIQQKGYLRARVDGTVFWLEEEIPLEKNAKHTIEIVLDRLRAAEEKRDRLSEAVQLAMQESDGFVLLVVDGGSEHLFTEKYICLDCGVAFPEIEPRLFSFNSPYGACPDCHGLGSHEYFAEDIAVDPALSVFDGAMLPWKGKHYMLRRLRQLADAKGWDLSGAFGELDEDLRQVVLYGSDERVPMTFYEGSREHSYMGRYEGLMHWLERRWNETESEGVREELARYRTEELCQTCRGVRLREEARSVLVDGHSLPELVSASVENLLEILRSLRLGETDRTIVHQVLEELDKRVSFLAEVGLGYLTLLRRADTLSGGEKQRIQLATQIGSKLSGVLYVLDEPTVGLHPRDTGRLLNTLREIRDLGNTVIVVEHDRDTMLAADHLVEMGPGAGEQGGEIVAVGGPEEMQSRHCLSGPYLTGTATGVVQSLAKRRPPTGWIAVAGAAENNLQEIDVAFPTGVLACLTGVSGSGKSSLMYEVLYKGLRRKLDRQYRVRPGAHRSVAGYEALRNVVLIDQSPIGRTPRSNPATYTGVFTPIRELFAQLPESRIRGYRPGRFSFNVKGGRCEACKGDGVVKVSMLFLPDVYVTCDVCKGKRFNRETLEVEHHGKNISDILEMTVDEALEQFADIPRIAGKLRVISEAGLGYIRLGQSATTLSGGEAQRVKLATELSKRFRGQTCYLLDEPTTGLHYTDVRKLLRLLHKLVDQGNSVLVIEHNLDVLASADYLVDLGPEGGERGGTLVAAGTPEDVAAGGSGHTSAHLSRFLEQIGTGGGQQDG